MISSLEDFNQYAYLHKTTIPRSHLSFLVGSMVVVVQLAFVVLVEDMLLNESHDDGYDTVITNETDGTE